MMSIIPVSHNSMNSFCEVMGMCQIKASFKRPQRRPEGGLEPYAAFPQDCQNYLWEERGGKPQ